LKQTLFTAKDAWCSIPIPSDIAKQIAYKYLGEQIDAVKEKLRI
jgi:hypothetical protein